MLEEAVTVDELRAVNLITVLSLLVKRSILSARATSFSRPRGWHLMPPNAATYLAAAVQL
jgi:hypothetical protein